jgi:hypothetical protein
MNTETILDGLLRLGEEDWIALWMIAGDVEEVLGIDDPNENLEITVGLVRRFLNGVSVQEIPRPEMALSTLAPGPIKTRMSSSISYDGNGRSEVTFQPGGTVHGLLRLKASGNVRIRCCQGEDRLSESLARNSPRDGYQHFRMAYL